MAVVPEQGRSLLDFYHEQTKDVSNELARVLTLHLCTEYVLNALLLEKSPVGKYVVKERSYTYAVKLSIVYSMGLIPAALYGNLKKLNSIRNKAAHELRFDLRREERAFEGQDGTSYGKWHAAPPTSVFAWIEYVTLLWLAAHCVLDHQFLPGYPPPQ